MDSTGHGLVTSSVMGGTLERQEGVNRCHGRCVGSPNPDLGSPRAIASLIDDLGPPRRQCSVGLAPGRVLPAAARSEREHEGNARRPCRDPSCHGWLVGA